ncbi:MAG: fumarylacetoacetase [Candidatus Baltobacteraceae bacterium]
MIPRPSWVPYAPDAPFGLDNLPFGAFARAGEGPRIGVALGDQIVDLALLGRAGLFEDAIPGARELFESPVLNPLLARGRATWTALRARLQRLFDVADTTVRAAGLADAALVAQAAVRLHLPVTIGDYVDFYSSIEHATNLGKILRPTGEPLLPNYRWIPIGYHGRAGSVVVSGTPIRRPSGQTKAADAPVPSVGPTRMLDFELELGFVTGDANALGETLSPARARESIFGVVLVNDWSARDMQGWEYQPLGPFLAKSFATSISPWVATLDALEPFRVDGPRQEPEPLEYLRTSGAQNYDLALEASLASRGMTDAGVVAATITRTNFRAMYWSMAQQLAHATSNGARVRAGDLFASGTISGADPGSYGSMIELTWRGARPLRLPDGSERAFLEDGDTVVMRGWCGDGVRVPRIGLGEVAGTILPAR